MITIKQLVPIFASVFCLGSLTAQTYDWVEVTVPGAGFPTGYDLSDSGAVTGDTSVWIAAHGHHERTAFSWSEGVGQLIHAVGLGLNSAGLGVNNVQDVNLVSSINLILALPGNEAIVGYSDGFHYYLPSWIFGNSRRWDMNGGAAGYSSWFVPGIVGTESNSKSINDSGEAIFTAEETYSPWIQHAYFRSASGVFTDLYSLPSTPTESRADDLNNLGRVLVTYNPQNVGPSTFSGVWDSASGNFVRLPQGGLNNITEMDGVAINDYDWVVGQGLEGSGQKMGFYSSLATGGAPLALFAPVSQASTYVADVNSRFLGNSVPEMVGSWTVSGASTPTALLWVNGVAVDIGSTTGSAAHILSWPISGRSIQLTQAVAINEVGQILVNGIESPSGDGVCFLLTPQGNPQSGFIPSASNENNLLYCQDLARFGDSVSVYAGASLGSTAIGGGIVVGIANATQITACLTSPGGTSAGMYSVPGFLYGTTVYTQFVNHSTGGLSEVRHQVIQ